MSELVPHIPALRRYARLLAGDAARADDLVQDTLERALRKWTLFRPGLSLRCRLRGEDGLRPWLLALMHNLWVSQLRRQRPERALDDDALIDGAGADGAAAGASASGLGRNALGADPAGAVALRLDTERALARLPEGQRAVLLLVVLEDMAYADVARVLELPIGTVMSRLSRARANLRAFMADAAPGAAPATAADVGAGAGQGAHDGGDAPDAPAATPNDSLPAAAPALRLVRGGSR